MAKPEATPPPPDPPANCYVCLFNRPGTTTTWVIGPVEITPGGPSHLSALPLPESPWHGISMLRNMRFWLKYAPSSNYYRHFRKYSCSGVDGTPCLSVWGSIPYRTLTGSLTFCGHNDWTTPLRCVCISTSDSFLMHVLSYLSTALTSH